MFTDGWTDDGRTDRRRMPDTSLYPQNLSVGDKNWRITSPTGMDFSFDSEQLL